MDYIVDNRANILPSDKERTVAELIESRINEALSLEKPFSLKIGVGFFFLDGFMKIYPKLRKLHEKGLLKEFRVIMGSETTLETKKMLEMIKLSSLNIENEDVYLFLKELYEKGIFKIRVFKDRRFHLKIYIIKIGDQTEIWGGSANFTSGGLEKNIELLVPFGSSSIDDIRFFESFYEELWNRSDENIEDLKVIDVLLSGAKETSSSLFVYLEPRTFFLHLIKLWKKDYLLKEKASEHYRRLAEFQKMTLDLVRLRLNRFGGCILANSVGLGKTEIASYLIKEFSESNKKVLVILPPKLIGHWKRILQNYVKDFKNIQFLSIGLLRKSYFNYQDFEGFDLIVIDEAHHFRNLGTNQRENLEKIISQNNLAKILLITATPINISIEDFINILSLLDRGPYRDALEREGIIERMQEVKKYISSEEFENYIISKHFQDTLRELMIKTAIRITWIDVKNHFKEDIIKISGRKIEEIEQPEVKKIEYEYDEIIVKNIFDKIIDFLQKLNFEYVKLWKGEIYETEKVKYLIGWFKWKLYKRLESSLEAFKISIENMLERTSIFYEFLSGKLKIEDIEKNEFLLKRIKKYLKSEKRVKKAYEAFLKSDEKNKKRILRNLEEDLKNIEKMYKTLESLFKNGFEDEKIETLFEVLKKEKTNNSIKPTIIFTESADTAKYIYEKLKIRFKEIENKIEIVHGRTKGEIEKDLIKEKFNKGKIDIIVCTDVLSEGIDLDRADIVINFDLPYNPVKLIQRSGRVFRITNPKKFKIYNFVPDERIDKEIELIKRLNLRINQIIRILGIDFIFWVFEREKESKEIVLSPQTVVNYIREWKEILSTQTPEKVLKSIQFYTSLEDLILRKYIEFFEIKEEELENIKGIKKCFYTTLVSKEKSGNYWCLYYSENNFNTFGDLIYTEEFKEDSLSVEEYKAIKSLIKEREMEILREIEVTRRSERREEKLLRNLLLEFQNVLELRTDEIEDIIMFFSGSEKAKIVSKLKQFKRAGFMPDEIKEFKSQLKELLETIRKEAKRDKDSLKIIAIIKYI